MSAWVRCSERMPEQGALVLCFLTFESYGELTHRKSEQCVLEYDVRGDEAEPWWDRSVGTTISREIVSHWMPLPEPPNGNRLVHMSVTCPHCGGQTVDITAISGEPAKFSCSNCGEEFTAWQGPVADAVPA